MMNQQELRDLEALCIQDCPPPCTTRCPLHVDVRGMMAKVAAGDFSGGFDLLSRHSPFPGIIAAVCEQPCQLACNLAERGGAIEMAAIEAACVLQSARVPAVSPIRPKSGRVAIVGGGLSGLVAAVDLARKGWGVTIFEASDQLGGALLATGVTPALLETDLALLGRLSVQVALNTSIASPDALLPEFSAVYLGTGAAAATDLACDPVTLASDRQGIFLGGSILHPGEPHTFIRSAAEGRRAAVSIDRFLQGVGLLSSRVIEEEGPYDSCLFTSLEGVDSVPPAAPAAAISSAAAEAITEAKRCLLCQCLECVKVCEFLDHFGDYPRKHFRTLYNNLSIVQGTRLANQFMNSCALCGLCAEVCPTDLDTGDAFLEARQIAVEQGKMPPSAHDFALRDMAFSQGDDFALCRHQPGMSESAYLFFPGCQLAGASPDTIEPVYSHLMATLDGGVGLIFDCCGAPARWGGRRALFEESCQRLRDRIAMLGNPTLVLACSSCMEVFREHLPGLEMTTLWEVFDQHGMPTPVHPVGVKAVAVHDPCTARHDHAAQQSVRRLLEGLGVDVHEFGLSREKTECCSFGGLMFFANRPLSDAVVRRRIAETPEAILTYCTMCREMYAGDGRDTFHILDLLVGSGVPYGRVGYFRRQENRARLRRHLGESLWGERSADMPDYAKYELLIENDDVLRRIEDRLILKEEIQQVLAHADATGERFVNPQTGLSLAHLRLGAVTYWVEYRQSEGVYIITKAYSHRIEVMEGEDL